MRTRSVFALIFALVCTYLFAPSGSAQTTTPPDDALQSPGISPWQSYQHGDFDSVNVLNGALTLHIPLYSLPQRGRLSLSFSIVANTTVWNTELTDTVLCQNCNFVQGSSYSPSTVRLVMDQRLDAGSDQFRYPANSNTFYNVFWIKDSTGSKHQLGYDAGNLALLRANDGSGLLYAPGTTTPYSPFGTGNGNGTIYESGGIQHIFNGTSNPISDPDGNTITFSQNAPVQITDSLNRTFLASPPAATSVTSGCPVVSANYQPTTGSAAWTLPGPNASQVTFLFCYATVQYRTNFTCIPLSGTVSSCNASATESLLQSIVLPNGTYWTFIYDATNPADSTSIGYGQVTQIRLPTGGTISYQYQTFKPTCAPSKTPNYSRSVTQRTFDPGNGLPTSTWNYVINYPTASNVVTDPLGNDNVYTFSTFGACDAHETQQKTFQGSQTTGRLLRTKATTYQYASNPQGGQFSGGFGVNAAVFPNKVTTTLDSGQTSSIGYSYDGGYSNVQPACTVTGSQTYFCTNSSAVQTSFGRQTYATTTDYSGSALKTVQTTYLFQVNGAYYAKNFLDAISSSTITGSSGVIAQSAFAYDENNGSPQGSFGHRTSATRWIQLNAASVRSQRVYNTQGMVVQSIDPNGNITKYIYDSSGAFLSQVQRPDTTQNGVTTHHVVNYTIDSITGRPLSFADENSNQTSFIYDNMQRLVAANYPDGGQTINCFSDSGGPTCSQSAPPYRATTSKKVSPSVTDISTAIVDGFAHLTQTQINSDPDGITYLPTVYDLLGRVSQTYNPTRCATPTVNCGESTWGYTSYAYDALGRTTSVTEQDGSIISTSYSGNCATVTDEAGKTRRSCTDALGRLIQVFEDPNGLNYETDYNYDALGNLLRVDQKGGTADRTKWRTRYFMYDSLSRLVSSLEPESGGANYTYDSNGNLLTRTANSASQSLSIIGNERTTTYTTCIIDQRTGECKPGTTVVHTVYDAGTVTISLNSFVKTVSYSQGSTSSTVASALASAFNTDSTSPVTASASSNSLTLTAKSATVPVYYTVSVSSATTNTTYFSGSSFSGTIAGLSLTAGGNSLVTTYAHDALSRLTQKSFSDGTPTANYIYDGAPSPSGCTLPALSVSNGIGRRTGMCDGAGAESWSYDKMARKVAEARTTNSITKSTSYSYNFDGSPATLTYPSGRTITYALQSSGTNTAGRLLSAVDSANSLNFVTAAHYSPGGSISALTFASGISSTLIFNSRLQPCWLYTTTGSALPWNSTACTSATSTGTLLDLKYNFSLGFNDNGNIAGITNDRDATRSQNFTYDALNRMATAQTQTSGVTIPNANCWGLTFGYDAWGNLSWTTSGPAGCGEPAPLSVSTNGANQIVGYCYDAGGNLLAQSAPPCVAAYLYDAENHLRSAGSVTYSYDGDGKRIMKSNGTIYWYGVGNEPLDETDLTGSTSNSAFHEYIFFNGKRVARRDSTNNVNYYLADHLGTSRVVVSASGSVLDDSDFYPFGGERPVLASSGNHYKFTGTERDAESGLDNFTARFANSTQGRFTSADPAGTTARGNPQALNRYSYALNNPLRYTDANGAYPQDQHEFFTFWLAVEAGRTDAQALAKGAGKADNFVNATTGLFGLGFAINYSKHFGKPPDSVQPGEKGGFDAHLIEDHKGPNAPHARGAWYHIWSNIAGHSVDTADSSFGGFRELGKALGLKSDHPVFENLEAVRKYANSKNAEIFQLSINGQTHGQNPDETWRLVSSVKIGNMTVNVYKAPDLVNVDPVDLLSLPGEDPMLTAAKDVCLMGSPAACEEVGIGAVKWNQPPQ